MTARRIFLIGLSGSGKSTVGRILADRLGWAFADSDREIEGLEGRTIGDIFRDDGEARFRDSEAATLRELATREPIVVATGGGSPTNATSRQAMGSGFVVWLAASPERAAERLAANPETEERPLIGGDTFGRLKAMSLERGDLYSRADAAVDVDELSPELVAGEIVNLWEEWRSHPAPTGERFYRKDGVTELSVIARPETGRRGLADVYVAAVVRTPTATYPVVVEESSLEDLGGICRDLGLKGRAFILTDDAVGPLYGPLVANALEGGGFEALQFAIPVGEERKNLATVSSVYDWLIGNHVERTDFVLCLGGGVVTDLGGFAAATCLRGVDFVHVPTSLLAMVDASIGGKTGVDHPRGKNMIGAFVQPRAVVIDPRVLRSLSPRQLSNG
ncbi:MAG: iron-containing alcohol dehydrogenase, partial [Tepidiformaceae bacterium]